MKKIIVITGASRGIGRNIAYNLALDEHIVVAGYNNSKEAAESLKKELNDIGKEIDICKVDVSVYEDIKNMIDYTIQKYGRIDVLINNAAIAQEKLFTEVTNEDFDIMMKTNLYSAFYASRETAKYMIKEHSGLIINISSIYGISGGSCEVPYSMAKAGMDGLTKALAKELGPSNIRVNSVAPGATDTDMNKNLTEDIWEQIKEETPLMRIGRPIDITRCIKWLIEDEFTTGQVISPNGGIVI